MKDLRIILFAFTGLGNPVLRSLFKLRYVKVISVFTKKYSAPYPYYNEIQIDEFCKSHDIKCFTDKMVNSNETISYLKNEKPDLIIVCSFNQKISNDVMKIPRLGIINFHPSLLPAYRGPYPEQAVILNGESKTGITVHYLSEKTDSGKIIYRCELKIDENEKLSSLKKRIADRLEKIVPEIAELFAYESIPEGTEQNEIEATYFKKPSAQDGYLENISDINLIKNKIRALNPFPGTSILSDGRRIEIDDFMILDRNSSHEKKNENETCLDLFFKEGGIRLFKKK